MVRVRQPGLLLGEWACLAALGQGRLHGFAVARRLAPDGDLGRVWTVSRPLTYRAIATLTDLGLIRSTGQEPGDGPTRLLLALTPKGRAALRQWLAQPVDHPRQVRDELLLKLVVLDLLGSARDTLVAAQLAVFQAGVTQRECELAEDPQDPVRMWRVAFATSAVQFLMTLQDTPGS